MGQNSIVLLENKGILPLDLSKAKDDICVLGPLADVWQLDWYSGLPPYCVTGLEGIEKYADVPFEKGLCEFKIKAGGKYLGLDESERLIVADSMNAEIFRIEQWDKKQFTIRSSTNGKLLSVRDDIEGGESGDICACKDRAFGWFVKEAFKIKDSENKEIIFDKSFSGKVTSWNDESFYIDKNGVLKVESAFEISGAEKTEDRIKDGSSGNECRDISETAKVSNLQFEIVADGIEAAAELAKKVKYPILFIGGDPMVTCKEDVDRDDIAFPIYQQKLLEAVYEANENVIVVLVSNVAFDISWAKEHVKAMILSASGCMELGTAIADTLFGKVSPAGRLSTTWYKDIDKLPPKEDYDIISHPRTYAYYDGEVLYPFGYGKTYSEIKYLEMRAEIKDYTKIEVCVSIENTGEYVTDEVVQIYMTKKDSKVVRAIKKLEAFERVKNLRPGEKRDIVLQIKIKDLKYYDVVEERCILEDGDYIIQAGSSSRDIYLSQTVNIKGISRGARDAWQTIKADHYDSYKNVYLHEGINGFDAVCTQDNEIECDVSYRDVLLKEAVFLRNDGTDMKEITLEILASIDDGGVVEVLADDNVIGKFVKGQTKIKDMHSEIGQAAFRTDKKMPWAAFERKTDFKKYNITVDTDKIPHKKFELKLRLKGYIRICAFKFA